MTTYYINNWNDWQGAITASQKGPYNFKLTTNITFSNAQPIFLSTLASQMQAAYILIRPGYTFDCNYFTLTIPVTYTYTVQGMVRMYGSAGSYATFKNFNITTYVTFENLINSDNFSGLNGTVYQPSYLLFEYGVVNVLGVTASWGYGIFLRGSDNGTAMNNIIRYIAIYSSAVINGGKVICRFFDGTMTNIMLSGTYYPVSRMIEYINPYSTTTFSSIYVYMSNPTIAYTPGQFMTSIYNTGTYVTTFTDIYIVIGTSYSTIVTGAITFGGIITTNFTSNANQLIIQNIYTNSSQFTIGPVAPAGPVTSSNINTSFRWLTAPSFSLSDFASSTLTGGYYPPNRLTCFTTFPFDSNVYTAYNITPRFLDYLSAPCFCAGMHIATPRGNIPVEDLKIGDDVYTPDDRIVPIVDIFHVEVLGDEENIPHRIPVDFFMKDVPNREVLLSPHHGLFDLRHKKWTLTRWVEPAIPRLEELVGERFMYYHIALPDYTNDKLICHLLPVDSWDKSKPVEY